MTTLTDPGFPTIANVIKTLAPDGSIEQQVANTLTKKLPLLQDMPWKMGNLQTGHRVTSVLGLPTPTWRQLNKGYDPSKAETVQYDESCGLLEDSTKVDTEVAKLSGNPAAYRALQDKIKAESFAQELERATFYESAVTNPERIHGLTPRYGGTAGGGTTGFTAAAYIMANGASGSTNESIYLINWDPHRVCGIFPKGTVGGLSFEDKGEQLVLDSNSKQFWAYVTRILWRVGLCVEDYRYVVRLQYKPGATNYLDTDKQLFLDMQNMIATVYDLMPTARFYMSRTSFKKLSAQLAAANTNLLQFVADGGTPVAHFMGVPIRITDQLVGETQI